MVVPINTTFSLSGFNLNAPFCQLPIFFLRLIAIIGEIWLSSQGVQIKAKNKIK